LLAGVLCTPIQTQFFLIMSFITKVIMDIGKVECLSGFILKDIGTIIMVDITTITITEDKNEVTE
jgi:hypothetical protein